MGDLHTPMTTKRITKFGTKAFFEKTPSLYRRIGNMFFSISSLGGTFAFLMENKTIGFLLFAMGVLGKVLTEFFSQEEIEKDYDIDTNEVEPIDSASVVDSLNTLPSIVESVKEEKIHPQVPNIRLNSPSDEAIYE